MTTLPSGLPVVVQRADSVPLAVQISAQLEAAVTGGVLHAGTGCRPAAIWPSRSA